MTASSNSNGNVLSAAIIAVLFGVSLPCNAVENSDGGGPDTDLTATTVSEGLPKVEPIEPNVQMPSIGWPDPNSFPDEESSEPQTLPGILTKPEGSGPFPAVVLLHGCTGIFSARDDAWVERLVEWEYVTLQVDSLGISPYDDFCGGQGVLNRTMHAFDAKAFLAQQEFVIADRIAVMGWSHGGWTVNHTLSPINKGMNPNTAPFRAGIALYPLCSGSLRRLTAPLMILIGEEDNWAPAGNCRSAAPATNDEGGEVRLLVYPDADHAFDVEDLNRQIGSIRLKYEPNAAADASLQVEAWLSTHLRDSPKEVHSELGQRARELGQAETE